MQVRFCGWLVSYNYANHFPNTYAISTAAYPMIIRAILDINDFSLEYFIKQGIIPLSWTNEFQTQTS